MKKIIKTIGIVSLLLSISCAKETITQVEYWHDTVVVKEIDTVIEPIIILDTLYITDTVIVEKNDTIRLTVTREKIVNHYNFADILSDFSLNSKVRLSCLSHSPNVECVVRELAYSEYNGTYKYSISYIKDYAIDYDRKCYYMRKQTTVYRNNDGTYNNVDNRNWTIDNSPTIIPCTFIK